MLFGSRVLLLLPSVWCFRSVCCGFVWEIGIEDKVNPVNFGWKRGEDEVLMVDRYTYLGVETSNDCSWDTHIAKVIGKGKTHVGKTDAMLTDSHLDTRIKRCILVNVRVPSLEHAAGIWKRTQSSYSSWKLYRWQQLEQARRVIQY